MEIRKERRMINSHEQLDIQPTMLRGEYTGNYRLLLDEGYIDLPGNGGEYTRHAAKAAMDILQNNGTVEEAVYMAWEMHRYMANEKV
jgi:hypothetical protein